MENVNYVEILVNVILNKLYEKNITASKIEKDLSLGNRTISHWKNGTQPTLEKLIKVLKYLDISLDEIIGIKPSNVELNENNILLKREVKDLNLIVRNYTEMIISNSNNKRIVEINANTLKNTIDTLSSNAISNL